MRHLFLILSCLVACRPGDGVASRHVEQVVDSVMPREEALRRFRDGVTEVRELSGGAASREALAKAVMGALAARDTARLRDLRLTKAEYAWLYYPTAAQGLPPYDLAPDLYWFTLEGRNGSALRTLLEEPASAGARYLRHDCGTASQREGDNTLWGPCTLWSVTTGGDTPASRALSLVIERGGKWKVVSYSAGRD
jgi:hypothetical protein